MIQRIEFAVAGLLLLAIVALVAIASVSRYMGSPIIWSIEIAQILFIWLCVFAADVALQRARHFGIEFIFDFLPSAAARVLRAVNLALIALLLGFLLYYAVDFTILSHRSLIGAMQLPNSLVVGALPVGFILMLRTVLAGLLDAVRGRERASPPEEAA